MSDHTISFFRRAVVALAILVMALAALPAEAQTDTRCFVETGYCISGRIRAYWERNGGIPVFGYPISTQGRETVEDRSIEVQWFERDRLEIQRDGTITAGRLGDRLLELRATPWESFFKVGGAPDSCRYFAITGHSLCEPFLSYWERNGGLERFGYPITEPHPEQIEGRDYTVQYFERRRMEIHPQFFNTPSEIQLGLLGNEVYGRTIPVLTP